MWDNDRYPWLGNWSDSGWWQDGRGEGVLQKWRNMQKQFIACFVVLVWWYTGWCHSPTSRREEVQNSSAIFLRSLPTSFQFSVVRSSLGTPCFFSLQQQLLVRRLGRRGGRRGRGLTPPSGVPRLGGGTGASDGAAALMSVIGTKSGSAGMRRMASLPMPCSWFPLTDGSDRPASLPPPPPPSLVCVSLSAKLENFIY